MQKRLDGLLPIFPALSHNTMYCTVTGQGHSWAGHSRGAMIRPGLGHDTAMHAPRYGGLAYVRAWLDRWGLYCDTNGCIVIGGRPG